MSGRGDAEERDLTRELPYDAGSAVRPLIARYGRDTVASSPATERFRAATPETLEQLPAQYEGAVARLGEMFAAHDAFDVLANLSLTATDPETRTEPQDPVAAVELAAAVLLGRPHRAADRTHKPAPLDYEAIEQRLRELLENRALRLMSDAACTADPDDRFAMSRAVATARRLTAREPSYEWQERATVIELFDQQAVQDDVLAACGFTASSALTLGDAIGEIGLEQLIERAARARETASETIASVNDTGEGSVAEDLDADTARALTEVDPADAELEIHSILAAWTGYQLGETLSFTASDLIDWTGLEGSEVRSYLSAFSIGFGERPAHDHELQVEDIQARPLAADGHGRYLCVSAGSLIWALRPRLERALNDHDPRALKRFERHRRASVESRAVAALTRALRPDWAHHDLHYDAHRDGTTLSGEIDGLLRIDTTLVTLDASAASMSPSARRPAHHSFRDWLSAEVGTAAAHTSRARQVLLDPAAPVRLTAPDGHCCQLDLDGVRTTFELIVVLEDLTAVAPLAWQLADAQILPSDPAPLLISLHDLELICEIVERPSELVHYLHRRRRLDQTRRAFGARELDYFTHCLSSALDSNEDGPASPPVQLPPRTTQLDSWFSHKRGQAARVKRPCANHPPDVAALLDCFAESDAPGRLDPALAILDFDEHTRQEIAATLSAHRRRSAIEGSTHEQTFTGRDAAITTMTMPPGRSAELYERLLQHVTRRQDQLKLDRCVGLGGWAGPPDPVQTAVTLPGPSEPNAQPEAPTATPRSRGAAADTTTSA